MYVDTFEKATYIFYSGNNFLMETGCWRKGKGGERGITDLPYTLAIVWNTKRYIGYFRNGNHPLRERSGGGVGVFWNKIVKRVIFKVFVVLITKMASFFNSKWRSWVKKKSSWVSFSKFIWLWKMTFHFEIHEIYIIFTNLTPEGILYPWTLGQCRK